MRNAVAAVALAVAVTAVVTVVATLGLTGCFQPVARPSPSPTPTVTATPTPTVSASPSPTLSPTPSPTIAPTPPPQQTRTPRPDPTTNIAGQQLIPYYFQARQQFPIFPPTPQIDFDMAADRDGDAFFRGLTPAGQPIFTVREDFVMTQRTAFHEI